MMRFPFLLLTFWSVLIAGAETPAARTWTELQVKREGLPSLHQEFEVTRTFKFAQGERSSKSRIVIDLSKGQWREKFVSGAGNNVRIFDGKDEFYMEEAGAEYVRTKPSPKENNLLPEPYAVTNADWPKAAERERRPCGIPKIEHDCVVLDVPLKPWIRGGAPNTIAKMLGGTARLVVDTQTGLLLSSRRIEVIDNGREAYHSDVSYALKRMTYGGAREESLFRLPSGDMKDVGELSRWDAAKLKKHLGGKPAPELTLTDLQGKVVALSGLKGRTVLLDFWTTWCGPCRADGPALDKLYRKYGGKELTVVGISVDEDRAVVEKFLTEHPHSYPVALTTENEMPRQYQIGVFPTYIVVDRDGTVSAAVEGDHGFGELRRLLKKAGLEAE